jgi:hypothetical protein
MTDSRGVYSTVAETYSAAASTGVTDTEGVYSREFSGTVDDCALIEVGRIQQ